MTDQEVLLKAIEKAQKNGYWPDEKAYVYKSGNFINVEFRPVVDAPGVYLNYEAVVYSHHFAEAFWGDAKKEYYANIGPGVFLYEWQYHLQMMVLEPDPITYLAKFLEEDK